MTDAPMQLVIDTLLAQMVKLAEKRKAWLNRTDVEADYARTERQCFDSEIRHLADALSAVCIASINGEGR